MAFPETVVWSSGAKEKREDFCIFSQSSSLGLVPYRYFTVECRKCFTLFIFNLQKALCNLILILQGSTETNKKRKIPRVTDEGWKSQKQLSDPMDEEREEAQRYPHPELLSLPQVVTSLI